MAPRAPKKPFISLSNIQAAVPGFWVDDDLVVIMSLNYQPSWVPPGLLKKNRTYFQNRAKNEV